MNEKKYIKTSQKIVTGLAGITFLLLVFLWLNFGYQKEWKTYQTQYIQLAEQLADSLGVSPEGLPGKGIYELDLQHLNRVDRCISCHNGIENPWMKNAPQPHSVHNGSFLSDHLVSEFGCTICHGGQGRAMNKKDAFGLDPETHWPQPILSQPYIQSSCGKCHLAIFNEQERMEGTEIFHAGQQIFAGEGCLGCHKARGVGGIIGPDLTEQGDKTKHEYNFQNVQGEQTVSNWMKEHFRDPEMVSPGSQMLSINLPEEDLDALATFVMGLSRPDIPFEYFSPEMLRELKGIRRDLSGEEVFSFTCSGCHGKNGDGKDYEAYATGVPAIMNKDFLRVASGDFIRFTVNKGRSQKQMASWAEEMTGYKDTELQAVAENIKNRGGFRWDYPPENLRNGDVYAGGELYHDNCMTCHGENGKGALGLALNQQDFLRKASDHFILATIAHGRENTAMPSWPDFTEQEIRDLMRYVRSWQSGTIYTARMDIPAGDTASGEILFHYNCSRCHGVNGEGNTGPSIINRDFLNAASNDYLSSTIAEGRSHTAMFGWLADLNQQEKLSMQDISNIIAYMKKKAFSETIYIYAGANPGNKSQGEALYMKNCAECHGDNGEGIKAPGLNSQEFLSAASNGYILATITLGREGTKMPDWGYTNPEHAYLAPRERQDIVAFIRSWQRIQIGF